MDLSIFTVAVVIAVGAVLSLAVWVLGHMFRKRIRGPARVVMMTVLLVLWYAFLWPLINGIESLEPATRRAYIIGVHSIWIWWVWAFLRFVRRVRDGSERADFKTGVVRATGLHRITAELKMAQERRAKKATKEAELPKQDEAPKQV